MTDQRVKIRDKPDPSCRVRAVPAVIFSPAPPWHLILVKFMHSKRQMLCIPQCYAYIQTPPQKHDENVPFVMIAQNLCIQ